MTQEERLDFLINYLQDEYSEKEIFTTPTTYAKKRNLFRMLVNVRPPHSIADDFIKVQDAFLQKEATQKGIVNLKSIITGQTNNRILLWQGDITRLKVDAIVNAANSEMLGCFRPGHHCIDNAIHTAAGIQLREECASIMEQQGHQEGTGLAKMTKGYNLPAKFVIHTVGPIVNGTPTQKQIRQLSQCYVSCLDIAVSNDLRSIAFCCISTGVFAFPKRLAAEIAIDTVYDYLAKDESLKKAIFNVFTDEDYQIYERLLQYV